MSFSEKSSWVMVISLLVGTVALAQFVLSASQASGALIPPVLPAFVIFTVVVVAIAVIGHILVAVSAVRDAAIPEDERDRAIARRAASASSAVLSFVVLLCLGTYLLTYRGDWLFYGVFAGLVLASLAEYALRIVLYRVG